MRRISAHMQSGEVIRFKNELLPPVLVVVDYQELGTVSVVIPINGSIKITVGNRAPELSIYDAPADIGDGNNVVPINVDD